MNRRVKSYETDYSEFSSPFFVQVLYVVTVATGNFVACLFRFAAIQTHYDSSILRL